MKARKETYSFFANSKNQALTSVSILRRSGAKMSGDSSKIILNNTAIEKEEIEKIRLEFESIVRLVVDKPLAVFINIELGSKSLVLRVSAPREEIGKLIGKSGKMADALRTLLTSISAKRGIRAVLDIED